MSNRNGYSVLGRLDVIANRPLLDVSAVLPAPRLSVDAGGGMTVSGAVDPQDYPGATVIRKGPVALRVEQTLSNRSTPSRTTFGLRRHMGCWWIVLSLRCAARHRPPGRMIRQNGTDSCRETGG